MQLPVLKKLSERERKIFFLVILTGCLALFYQYLLEPGCNQIKELNEQTNTTQNNKEIDDRVRSLTKIIQKEYDHYQIYLKPLKTVAEENRALGELISDFARKSKVTIIDLKAPNEKEIKALLTCEGKISAIISLIYDLTYVEQLLQIEKIDLALKSPREDTINCNITISRIQNP